MAICFSSLWTAAHREATVGQTVSPSDPPVSASAVLRFKMCHHVQRFHGFGWLNLDLHSCVAKTSSAELDLQALFPYLNTVNNVSMNTLKIDIAIVKSIIAIIQEIKNVSTDVQHLWNIQKEASPLTVDLIPYSLSNTWPCSLTWEPLLHLFHLEVNSGILLH